MFGNIFIRIFLTFLEKITVVLHSRETQSDDLLFLEERLISQHEMMHFVLACSGIHTAIV